MASAREPIESTGHDRSAETPDSLYQAAIAAYGPALVRLARGYEADEDARRDLLQEIHVSLWQSFHGFDARASVRTWVYRVAHNVAASHVLRNRRANEKRRQMTLAELEALPHDGERPDTDRRRALERLVALIQELSPPDRQVILLYLEGVDAAAIGEITGLSPGNVATKVHRIKSLLARRFREGERDGT